MKIIFGFSPLKIKDKLDFYFTFSEKSNKNRVFYFLKSASTICTIYIIFALRFVDYAELIANFVKI